ncbi:hypothetical protein E2I00_006387, partial [Balaenoptera physalus]
TAETRGQDAFLPSCSTIFVLLQLRSILLDLSLQGKADFKVFGPGKPVQVMVGEDAELPCYLSPDISAEDMELRWYTDQPSKAVHVHGRGEDVQQEHSELYRGRTTFSQAAVIIHNVTTFDNGTFHCQFNSTMSEEAMLCLRVAGLGMEPIIRVQVDQDEGVWAECTSAAWYAEPQVEWRDFRGHTLPSVINRSASPTTGLWTAVSNVTLQYGAVKGLSCPIFNPLLLEKKVDKIDLPGECSVLAFKDGKSTTELLFEQELPNNPSRFDQDPCMLDWEQFPSRR